MEVYLETLSEYKLAINTLQTSCKYILESKIVGCKTQRYTNINIESM